MNFDKMLDFVKELSVIFINNIFIIQTIQILSFSIIAQSENNLPCFFTDNRWISMTETGIGLNL